MNKKSKVTSFGSQLFTLVGGTLGTYLFPIIFAPILTRIYNPQEFSVYTIYITIVQIVAIISALKYELGIPLVNNRNERINLFRISVINTFLISLFVFTILSLYDFFNPSSLNMSLLKYFVPTGIILMSMFHHVLYNWLLYKKFFKYISFSKIVFGFLYAILPIFLFYSFGFKNYKYLIFSHQVALLVGLFIIFIFICLSRKELFKDIQSLFIFKIKDLLHVLKKYKKYPLFSSPSQLINVLGIWLPVIMIWLYFDYKYASLYFLSHRSVNMPVMLLGHSIGKIFYSEAASNLNKGRLNESISKYFKLLFHLAFPFLFICIFLAPNLFDVVFSKEWSEAGLIVQILSPWLFVLFIASPLSTIPTILYKQEVDFKFNSFLLIVRVFALIVGVFYDSLLLALILFSSFSAILWIFYLMYMLKLCGIKTMSLFMNCLNNKYQYLVNIFLILGIYFFIIDPVHTLICMIPLLAYLFYSFILELRKV